MRRPELSSQDFLSGCFCSLVGSSFWSMLYLKSKRSVSRHGKDKFESWKWTGGGLRHSDCKFGAKFKRLSWSMNCTSEELFITRRDRVDMCDRICGFWDRLFTSLVNICRLPGLASIGPRGAGLLGGHKSNEIDRYRTRWAGPVNRDDTRARLQRSSCDKGSRMSNNMSLGSISSGEAMLIVKMKSDENSSLSVFKRLEWVIVAQLWRL